MRTNILAKVVFGKLAFSMEMFQNDWGPDDPILHQALNASFDENLSLAWWYYFTLQCPPSSLILDVGAYSGLFSLISAKARDDVHVIAFEPSTVTWGRLVRNLHLNLLDPQILAANLAAWDTEEWVTFQHPYGIYTMCPGESALMANEMDHSTSSRAIRLDQILEERDRLPDYLNSTSRNFLPTQNVAIIKIDVEGVEPRVLAGAEKIISTYRPCLICEALSDEAKQKLLDLFGDRNYKYIHIPKERNIIFIPAEKFEALCSGFESWSNTEFKEIELIAHASSTYTI